MVIKTAPDKAVCRAGSGSVEGSDPKGRSRRYRQAICATALGRTTQADEPPLLVGGPVLAVLEDGRVEISFSTADGLAPGIAWKSTAKPAATGSTSVASRSSRSARRSRSARSSPSRTPSARATGSRRSCELVRAGRSASYDDSSIASRTRFSARLAQKIFSVAGWPA